MSRARYTIGVDFGTESARAVLVDVGDGRELGVAVHRYATGSSTIASRRPTRTSCSARTGRSRTPTTTSRRSGRPCRRVVAESGIDPVDVIGIGIDFTACTMLPTTADGTPLCFLDAYRREPHAWVKLWKHHAAQPEADEINRVAAELGEPWLDRYGGKISSEWFFPKALQILHEAPDVYAAADRLIEAADWVVWQLTGVETRNNCTAGYKAIWSAEDGFPDARVLRGPRPALRGIVDDKMSRPIAPVGERAGRPDRAGRGLDRPPARDRGRGRQRRCPRLGAGGDGHRAGHARGDHGHEHLPRRPGGRGAGGPGHVRGRPGRRHPRPVRLRGRAVGCRRHLRLVRRQRRATGLSTSAARDAGPQRPRGPGRGGRRIASGRVGAARPRLVERQPVRARRRRPVGVAHRADPGQPSRPRSTGR